MIPGLLRRINGLEFEIGKLQCEIGKLEAELEKVESELGKVESEVGQAGEECVIRISECHRFHWRSVLAVYWLVMITVLVVLLVCLF